MVVKNQKLSPAALYAGLKQKSQTFARNFRNVCAAAKEQGFSGIANCSGRIYLAVAACRSGST